MATGQSGYPDSSLPVTGGDLSLSLDRSTDEQPSLSRADSSLTSFSGRWKSSIRPSSIITIYGDTVTMWEPGGSDCVTTSFSAPGDGSCTMETWGDGRLSDDGNFIRWGSAVENDVWLRLPFLAVGQEVKVTLVGTLVEKEESGRSWSVQVGPNTLISISEANIEHIDAAEAEGLKQVSSSQEAPASSRAAVARAVKEASKAAATAAAAEAVAQAAKAREVAVAGAEKAAQGLAAGAAAAGAGASKVQNWLRGRFGDNTKQPQPVEAQRRRLSVGHVCLDEALASASADAEQKEDPLVIRLNKQSLTDILESSELSHVASIPNAGRTSFAAKELRKVGKPLDPNEAGLGYTCRKGLKPEGPNQDSFFVVRVLDDFSMYGVMDGHGQHGHDVASFVKDFLPKLIVQDPRFQSGHKELPSVCIDAFEKMQRVIVAADREKKLNAQMSGCSASVVIHDHVRHELTVAHVSDSTVVLASKTQDGDISAKELTRDHKPNLRDEQARIEKNGGRVVFDGYANHRVYARNARYPGLNMSRCLGDLLAHQDAGIIATPEVSVIPLQPDDAMIVLCSDGVWEFITPVEASKILAGFSKEKSMTAAERLAKDAWDRWIMEEGGMVVDDITVVFAHLTNTNRRVVTCEGVIDPTDGSIRVTCWGLDGTELGVVKVEVQEDVRKLQIAIADLTGDSAPWLQLISSDGQVLQGSQSLSDCFGLAGFKKKYSRLE